MSSKETLVQDRDTVEKKRWHCLFLVAIWNHLLKGSRCIKQDAMTCIYFGCCCNKKLPYLWHVSSKAKVSSDKNVHNLSCTQLMTSGTIFHALSHDMINFVRGADFMNHNSRNFWEFLLIGKKFLGLALKKNRSHCVRGHEILCQKMTQEVVVIFVLSHLCLWIDMLAKVAGH